MASTLSDLVNNLSEGNHIIRRKYGHDGKNFENCRIKYKFCNCCLEYINFKDDWIEYKFLCCNKDFQLKFDKKLKERFFNKYNFLPTIIISLFYCCKKVFILMSIWMIRKNLMKHHYLKKRFLQTLKHEKYYFCRLPARKKSL